MERMTPCFPFADVWLVGKHHRSRYTISFFSDYCSNLAVASGSLPVSKSLKLVFFLSFNYFFILSSSVHNLKNPYSSPHRQWKPPIPMLPLPQRVTIHLLILPRPQQGLKCECAI